ncbi:hypothetical protein [Lacticaseibacillus daqingensis]|uniref:hypothetical protein n=1 Tax=Lacticaseibacillus daqingensis TaxID=2486014 RepID=UPI000F77ED2D|nr:hypothetical protein [Lacticaseibacillus daqingensis]
MFPIGLTLSLTALTILLLIRDQFVRRYLLSTMSISLTFGYTALQLYAVTIAQDAGAALTSTTTPAVAELGVSAVLLAVAFIRALREEVRPH